VRAPQVRRVEPTSAVKFANIVHVTHRDEVEAPLTDWLREAFELQDTLAAKRAKRPARRASAARRKTSRAAR